MIDITTFINCFTFDDDSLPKLQDKAKSLMPAFEASVIKHREDSSVMEYTLGELNHIKNCIALNLDTARKVMIDYGADTQNLISTYSQLAVIVDSEIRFCKRFSGSTDIELEKEVIAPKKENIISSNLSDGIIKGVDGLANALKIGKNKAQAIISSKILLERGIQYKAGGWRFKRKELDELLKNEPLIFEDVKCKR